MGITMGITVFTVFIVSFGSSARFRVPGNLFAIFIVYRKLLAALYLT